MPKLSYLINSKIDKYNIIHFNEYQCNNDNEGRHSHKQELKIKVNMTPILQYLIFQICDSPSIHHKAFLVKFAR